MAELRELQAFLDAGSVDAEVFALRNAAADEPVDCWLPKESEVPDHVHVDVHLQRQGL